MGFHHSKFYFTAFQRQYVKLRSPERLPIVLWASETRLHFNYLRLHYAGDLCTGQPGLRRENRLRQTGRAMKLRRIIQAQRLACDLVSRLFSEWFVFRSTAFGKPYSTKRTVSTLLYCGVARFALLLYATCIRIDLEVRGIQLRSRHYPHG